MAIICPCRLATVSSAANQNFIAVIFQTCTLVQKWNEEMSASSSITLYCSRNPSKWATKTTHWSLISPMTATSTYPSELTISRVATRRILDLNLSLTLRNILTLASRCATWKKSPALNTTDQSLTWSSGHRLMPTSRQTTTMSTKIGTGNKTRLTLLFPASSPSWACTRNTVRRISMRLCACSSS